MTGKHFIPAVLWICFKCHLHQFFSKTVSWFSLAISNNSLAFVQQVHKQFVSFSNFLMYRMFLMLVKCCSWPYKETKEEKKWRCQFSRFYQSQVLASANTLPQGFRLCRRALFGGWTGSLHLQHQRRNAEPNQIQRGVLQLQLRLVVCLCCHFLPAHWGNSPPTGYTPEISQDVYKVDVLCASLSCTMSSIFFFFFFLLKLLILLRYVHTLECTLHPLLNAITENTKSGKQQNGGTEWRLFGQTNTVRWCTEEPAVEAGRGGEEMRAEADKNKQLSSQLSYSVIIQLWYSWRKIWTNIC